MGLHTFSDTTPKVLLNIKRLCNFALKKLHIKKLNYIRLLKVNLFLG